VNTGTSTGSTGAIDRSAEELGELARAALRDGTEEQTLPILRRAAERQRDARLWQWTGLLQRALDDHQDAIRSFTNAARLAPDDQGIAHGRARVSLEAGLDAVALFEAARKLGPAKGDLLIGQAAARFAAGRGEEAVADLESILLQVPLWLEGHVQLAQLRSLLGRADEAAVSLERAVGAYPSEQALWNALLALRLRQENYWALAEATSQAEAAGLPRHLAVGYQAIAAAELGEVERADALFESAPPAAEAGLAIWRIRHLLRTSRVARALPLIDAELASERAAGAWPYAAAAWRLSGDPRWAWLEGDERSCLSSTSETICLTWRYSQTGSARSTSQERNISINRFAAELRRMGRSSAGSSPRYRSCAARSWARSKGTLPSFRP
jgi:tetratricopeptide (TPR) repeat protein